MFTASFCQTDALVQTFSSCLRLPVGHYELNTISYSTGPLAKGHAAHEKTGEWGFTMGKTVILALAQEGIDAVIAAWINCV